MVLIGVLGLAAAGAYWSYQFDPRSIELDEREEHVETLAARNERAKLELTRGDPARLRREAETVRQNLELMRQLVPTSNEVPALLEQVSTAARRVGLDIGGVEPEPVLEGEQFDTYRYKITLTGDYHALGAFLANVGSLTRIMAPVNVQLRPPQARGGPRDDAARRRTAGQQLDAQLQIQTYVARTAPAVGSASTAPEGPR
jgi:type IV pilus assembly protein PilO